MRLSCKAFLIRIACLVLVATVIWRNSLALDAPSSRIVGGSTTTIASVPYLVNLRLNGRVFCGGTLVSKVHVVTAAHCVYGLRPSSIIVTGGATYISETGIQRSVQKIITPHAYHSKTMNADVAVLKLSSEMRGTNIASIGLCNANWSVGQLIEVSGWGQTKETNENVSNQVRSVMVPLIARSTCMQQYRGIATITKTMFCASLPSVKDACAGDSGGPAIYKERLCGIVSWGVGCARSHYPGVYTNVRTVQSFIQAAMKK